MLFNVKLSVIVFIILVSIIFLTNNLTIAMAIIGCVSSYIIITAQLSEMTVDNSRIGKKRSKAQQKKDHDDVLTNSVTTGGVEDDEADTKDVDAEMLGDEQLVLDDAIIEQMIVEREHDRDYQKPVRTFPTNNTFRVNKYDEKSDVVQELKEEFNYYEKDANWVSKYEW